MMKFIKIIFAVGIYFVFLFTFFVGGAVILSLIFPQYFPTFYASGRIGIPEPSIELSIFHIIRFAVFGVVAFFATWFLYRFIKKQIKGQK